MKRSTNEKYAPLFRPLTLPNGTVLGNRLGVTPMTTFAGSPDGVLTDEELAHYRRRNNIGQLGITGAVAVSPHGRLADVQFVAYEDEENGPVLAGLTRLAETLRARGNKAVLQLQHGGREAHFAEVPYGPSDKHFPWHDRPTTGLSEEGIAEVVREFGDATRMALKAGFDGVEIHGANHYLLQQFFSTYSNERDDAWGGDLAGRMRFALEVVREVRRVVDESGRTDFLVGYRISPEEVHGETVGYTVDEALELVDEVVKAGVDYVHTSLAGGFRATAQGDDHPDPVNQRVRERIAGRVAFVVSGEVWTPEDAIEALTYGDVVTLGRAALIEPDWSHKLLDGREAEIRRSTGREQDPDLQVPVRMWEKFLEPNSYLPPLPLAE